MIILSNLEISHSKFLILSLYLFFKEENSELLISKLIILQSNLDIKRSINSLPIPRQPPVIKIVVSFDR